jgi:L-ascorbate metabolism protein UlaG (beta-lactamase superfamily)
MVNDPSDVLPRSEANQLQIQWYGQSAFRLSSPKATVVIDPFGDILALTSRGIQFDYPPIADVTADLVLITHEHGDHNAHDVVGGDPPVLRSTAGRLDSPIGEVTAVASEHDPAAGTQRGPNTIFVFELDGIRVAHLGDLGQRYLRDEQVEAIGPIDLLMIPVGGGPTIAAAQAAAVVGQLAPRWVVPMHYRTPRVNFLDPVDPFLERMANVQRYPESHFDTDELGRSERPLVVVPASP